VGDIDTATDGFDNNERLYLPPYGLQPLRHNPGDQ
jgi:hypothetical protein